MRGKKTGGRQKGTPNKRRDDTLIKRNPAIKRRTVHAILKDEMPLEFMLARMRNPNLPLAFRAEMAFQPPVRPLGRDDRQLGGRGPSPAGGPRGPPRETNHPSRFGVQKMSNGISQSLAEVAARARRIAGVRDAKSYRVGCWRRQLRGHNA